MTNIYEQVTVEDFKNYFKRDFPYLPVYVEGKTYWIDDIVYYEDNFYKSLIDDNTSIPTDIDNWQKIKGDIEDYITDDDIKKAMSQAIINANSRFGSTDDERITIYLHLIAFYLVVDINNANAGVRAMYLGITQSKSVGDVSESYAIPAFVSNNPLYSIFMQNGYGMKYLSLIAPYLAITIIFSRGGSTCG